MRQLNLSHNPIQLCDQAVGRVADQQILFRFRGSDRPAERLSGTRRRQRAISAHSERFCVADPSKCAHGLYGAKGNRSAEAGRGGFCGALYLP